MVSVRPSRSRSRASRLGRCRTDAKAGNTRTTPGTANECCRAAVPNGPNDLMVRRSVWRSPRRVGVSRTSIARRSPAASRRCALLSLAPADGCQASRRDARSVRFDPLMRTRRDVVVWPSRVGPVGVRWLRTRRGDAASTRSMTRHAMRTSSTTRNVSTCGASANGTTPSSATSASRPVIATYRPQRGVGTEARIPSSTLSGLTPSISASGRTRTR